MVASIGLVQRRSGRRELVWLGMMGWWISLDIFKYVDWLGWLVGGWIVSSV